MWGRFPRITTCSLRPSVCLSLEGLGCSSKSRRSPAGYTSRAFALPAINFLGEVMWTWPGMTQWICRRFGDCAAVCGAVPNAVMQDSGTFNCSAEPRGGLRGDDPLCGARSSLYLHGHREPLWPSGSLSSVGRPDTVDIQPCLQVSGPKRLAVEAAPARKDALNAGFCRYSIIEFASASISPCGTSSPL